MWWVWPWPGRPKVKVGGVWGIVANIVVVELWFRRRNKCCLWRVGLERGGERRLGGGVGDATTRVTRAERLGGGTVLKVNAGRRETLGRGALTRCRHALPGLFNGNTGCTGPLRNYSDGSCNFALH